MLSPRFTIELQDTGGKTPAAIRLRRLLKIAARSLGLRVVGMREKPPEQSGDPSSKPAATTHRKRGNP